MTNPELSRTGNFTQLLTEWRSGQDNALERLTPLVYDELRRLAHKYMRGERGSHTLQATAVVHEAFLRLIQSEVPMQDRTHFFAIASRLMRRVLVDHARGRSREKRFSVAEQVSMPRQSPGSEDLDFDIIDLDNAIEHLNQMEPRLAQVVELHYFGGLSTDQIGLAVNCSAATIQRDLRLARAWLLNQLWAKRS